MDSRGEAWSGQVEWLDLGPAESVPGTAQQRRRRRSWWLLLAAAVAAAVLVVSLNTGGERRTAAPSHSPASAPRSSPTATTPTSPTTPTPQSSAAAVVVSDAGHRLLDVPAGWELFGRGPNVVVRIELARGRVTQTTVPALQSGGGVGFLIGANRVIIRPYDNVPGYVVPDGRPARELPAALGGAGAVLTGPDPDHIWAQNQNDRAVRLVGYDGRPTTVLLPIPDGAQVIADGAGYVAFYGTGGVYDVRLGGVSRITRGELVATGPTRWLARECDEHYRCSLVVIDHRSRARRALTLPPGGFNDGGLIAPDGSVAALLGASTSGRLTVHLVELSTGADRETGVALETDFGFDGGAFVWSPDSRSLFVLAGPTRVLVLDRRTRHVATLRVTLPPIGQLAFRTRPG